MATTTDRQKWEIIFKELKKLCRKQKSLIDSLLQDQVYPLRRLLELSEMANLVEKTKAEWIMSSKKLNAFVHKRKLDDARHELEDFKAWFDILSHRCPGQEDIDPDWLYEILRSHKGGKDGSPKAASEEHCKMLEKEVATLKREYEKLSLKNSSEVSSLRAEIKFAWNQYNEKEANFTHQLQAKNAEVNKANEKISALLSRLEQLQSSNAIKDQMASTLKAKVNRLEEEARQKDKMITQCSKELGLLKSERPIGLPTLKRCSTEPAPSNSECRRSSRNDKSPVLEEVSSSTQLKMATAKLNKLEGEVNLKNGEIARLSKELNLLRTTTIANTPVLGRCTRSKRSVVPKVETSSAQLVSLEGGRHSKRKQVDVINIEDTPRLFTSQFKIPRLKSQTPSRK